MRRKLQHLKWLFQFTATAALNPTITAAITARALTKTEIPTSYTPIPISTCALIVPEIASNIVIPTFMSASTACALTDKEIQSSDREIRFPTNYGCNQLDSNSKNYCTCCVAFCNYILHLAELNVTIWAALC